VKDLQAQSDGCQCSCPTRPPSRPERADALVRFTVRADS
jgi:hypothetical protein